MFINFNYRINPSESFNNFQSEDKRILEEALKILNEKDENLIKRLREIVGTKPVNNHYTEIETLTMKLIWEKSVDYSDSTATDLIFHLFKYIGITRSRDKILAKLKTFKEEKEFAVTVTNLKTAGFCDSFFNYETKTVLWLKIAANIIQKTPAEHEIHECLKNAQNKYRGKKISSTNHRYSNFELKIFHFFIDFCKSGKLENCSVFLIQSQLKDLGRQIPTQKLRKTVKKLTIDEKREKTLNEYVAFRNQQFAEELQNSNKSSLKINNNFTEQETSD